MNNKKTAKLIEIYEINMMKTAIVIGATGLIGKQLVCRLAQEDYFEKVVAVTRRPVSYQSDKIVNEVIDFDALGDFSHVFKGDVLFSCLGTTAKQAGSIEAQRVVDLDYQYQIAKIATDNGINHYMLVSSSGANAKSKNAYLKMKGKLEDAVSALPFERISILQPSLLLGDRDTFRLGETIGSWVLPTLCKLPSLKRYRPISGDEVAKKMVSVSMSVQNNADSNVSSEGRKEIYKLDEIFS